MDNTIIETLLDMLGRLQRNAAIKLLTLNNINTLFGTSITTMSTYQLYLALRSYQMINILSKGK